MGLHCVSWHRILFLGIYLQVQTLIFGVIDMPLGFTLPLFNNLVYLFYSALMMLVQKVTLVAFALHDGETP